MCWLTSCKNEPFAVQDNEREFSFIVTLLAIPRYVFLIIWLRRDVGVPTNLPTSCLPTHYIPTSPLHTYYIPTHYIPTYLLHTYLLHTYLGTCYLDTYLLHDYLGTWYLDTYLLHTYLGTFYLVTYLPTAYKPTTYLPSSLAHSWVKFFVSNGNQCLSDKWSSLYREKWWWKFCWNDLSVNIHLLKGFNDLPTYSDVQLYVTQRNSVSKDNKDDRGRGPVVGLHVFAPTSLVWIPLKSTYTFSSRWSKWRLPHII